MVSSRSNWCVLPSLVLLSLSGAAGCGAAGASSEPSYDEDAVTPAPVTPAPVNPASGTGPSPSPTPSLVSDSPSEPAASGDPDACVSVSAAVEVIRQPVDIIIAIDNSGSMDDEARAVETNINVNFAAILEQSGVDYRVILVSEHRENDLQDTAVCIASPLSSVAACPSDAPGPSARFFHYATGINSRNSFEVLLETFNGEREDEFELAPNGWSEWLRPEAKKVFLEITDDNSNTPVVEFISALTQLAPEQFGTDPSQLRFVWHSIVGLAELPVATDPYAPADPIETRECTGNVYNAGAVYQELSRLTGGLRFPICEFDGYDAVFRRIAADVVQNTTTVCNFAIPAPPEGRVLDLDKVAVSYQPGGGGTPLLLGRAATAADCRADGFVMDAATVSLCPQACDVVGTDDHASVSVLFTCESTLLR
jgi:hypothetical protein